MALRKIIGVETEFGIIVRGAGESNPIAASSVLINAYVHELARAGEGPRTTPKVGWDFEDEHPDIDARGFTAEGTLAPEVETHLVNAVLTNGARYYVDHAHPELSTPECADARSVVVWDKAAELVLQWGDPARAWSLFEQSLGAPSATEARALYRFADLAAELETPPAWRARGLALRRLAGMVPEPLAVRAHADAAKAFIAFLTRPAFKPKFAAAGLDYR